LNILFLTPEYPHEKLGYSGGIGTNIKNLSYLLAEQGNNIHVLIYGQKSELIFQDGLITITAITNIHFKGLSWLLTRIKLSKKINELVKNYNIQIIEVPDWTGISAFLFNRVPVVMRLNGSDSYFCQLENRPVKFFNRFFELRAFSSANGIIAVSDFVGKQTNLIFNKTRNYTVVPNAIILDEFTELGIERRNLNDKKLTLCYFGSLNRKKGVLQIPKFINEVVIKTHIDLELVIIGRDCNDPITGCASTFQLMHQLFDTNVLDKVNYLGAQPKEETMLLVKQADICIFPSYAEALPLSWLEAMAMGKSLVASNIGWATELIEHGKDGFLCHPDNIEGFVDYILQLMESGELRESMGAEAKNKARQICNKDALIVKNIEFYNRYILD